MEPMIAQVSSDGQYPPKTSESPAVATTDGSTYGNAILYSGNANPTAEGAGGNPKCNSEPVEGTSATGSVVGYEYKTVESTCAAPAPYGSFNGGTNVAISTTEATIENGNTLSDLGAPVDQQPGDVYGVSTEEERLWSLVRTNCLDFNAWTSLIHETEKENNILKIRNVYDSFLAEFPLCYGYWKKYADHEGSLSTVDKVKEVYEHAVSAVTYSVDIWVHYCQFKISTHGDPDNIRRLFERGLAYVGIDYLSAPLWDEYIKYEFALQEWSNVTVIYTRILENPIQQLDRYFNSFKEYAASQPLAEIRTAAESATLSVGTETTEQGIEGEVCPDDMEKSSLSSVSTESREAEELEKYIAIREEMYNKTKEFDSMIIQFETAITRPYFHVKPLDQHELENWHNYLDFFESGDDINKVVKLYERCLIACANYPEYWIRYVSSMEASGSMELANNALARATQVFVKKQPDIHLFAARFKEHNGDIVGARAEYQHLYFECSSVLLEGIVRHANMEYRLGNKDAAFSVYEEAITHEQSKEHTQILPFLFVQYSRFSFFVAGNAEKAREITTDAIGKVHLSNFFIEAVIQLESLLPTPKRIDYLDSLVKKFMMPSPDDSNVASTSCIEEVSCIFLEFLDLFGDSQSIKKAEKRHFKSFLHQRSTLVSRKRRSEDYLEADKIKVSKTHTGDLSSSQSVMGAYPIAQQNPWSGSYGQNPPSWSSTQGQQQWNSGYAPQDGHSGYGSFGSYAQPQVPALAPQTTTYGAYPATSTVQNYAQPAAAAAYTPHATAATQAYYSNYY